MHYICGVNYLDNDIKFVPGVGEARARLLDKELGIRTLGDMLNHFPFRYIDRTRIYRIGEITEGGPSLVQFRARVTGIGYAGQGRKRRFTVSVSDPTGSAELVWFAGIKWVEKRIEVGREYLNIRPPPASTTTNFRWFTPNSRRWSRPSRASPRAACRAIYSTHRAAAGRRGDQGALPHHAQHVGARRRPHRGDAARGSAHALRPHPRCAKPTTTSTSRSRPELLRQAQ